MHDRRGDHTWLAAPVSYEGQPSPDWAVLLRGSGLHSGTSVAGMDEGLVMDANENIKAYATTHGCDANRIQEVPNCALDNEDVRLEPSTVSLAPAVDGPWNLVEDSFSGGKGFYEVPPWDGGDAPCAPCEADNCQP